MVNFNPIKLIMATPLFFQLLICAFNFKKPIKFIARFSFKSKIGCAGLLYFVKRMKRLIEFSTTSKQKREIIFYFVQMSQLIEKAFDKNILEPNSFRNVLLKNEDRDHPDIKEIKKYIEHIREINPNNIFHEEFLDNIIKAWETHRIRDVKQRGKVQISDYKVLEATENRGIFYFLSLIYALNPSNLNIKLKRIVSIVGSWFQIIDDYADRKKDKNKKNTPFTISQEKSYIIFDFHIVNYQKQLQVLLNKKHSLIKFMKNVSVLWPLSPSKLDWNP